MYGQRWIFSYIKYRDTHVNGIKLRWELWPLWIKFDPWPSYIYLRNSDTRLCVSLLAPQLTMTRNSLCRSPGIYLLTTWCGQNRTAHRPDICHEKEMAANIHSEFEAILIFFRISQITSLKSIFIWFPGVPTRLSNCYFVADFFQK